MRQVQVCYAGKHMHRMRLERHLFGGRSRRLHALPDARPATDAEASTDACPADACPADATAYATDAPATDTRSVEIHRAWLVLYQQLAAC